MYCSDTKLAGLPVSTRSVRYINVIKMTLSLNHIVFPLFLYSTSPTSSSPVVKTNHPWMAIVHPGPWTQLPPAPAPVPTPRSKSVCNQRGLWYRPKPPAPNPFEEETDEDAHQESEDQSKPTAEAKETESGDNLTNVSLNADAPVSSNDAEKPDLKDAGGGRVSDGAEGRDLGRSSPEPNTTSDHSDIAQDHLLPRSLSVPAMTSEHSQSSSVPSEVTEVNESVTSSQNKVC